MDVIFALGNFADAWDPFYGRFNFPASKVLITEAVHPGDFTIHLLCPCNFLSLFYSFSYKFHSFQIYVKKCNPEFLFCILPTRTTINYFANTTPINSPAKRITILISIHHQSLPHLGIIIFPSLVVRIVHDRKSFFKDQR